MGSAIDDRWNVAFELWLSWGCDNIIVSSGGVIYFCYRLLIVNSYDSILRMLVFRKIAIDGVEKKSSFSIVLSIFSFYGYS